MNPTTTKLKLGNNTRVNIWNYPEKIAYPYDIDYTPPSKTFIYSFSIQYYKYFHFQFYLCTEQMPN
ncbi:hypothetical protein GAIMETA21S07_11320 [Phocaeicola vulgatus]|nr:hypothetical protein GAIMETA21S03_11150 [Phocaeicola vulgatus]BDC09344.1 hypothetical protein GAIMETA21S07_11320 [Phocaeicola vulgatus]BDC13514.1 hypothetical protein GAIMETA21S10_12780 [Phocaeicola vulgatus]